MKKIGLVGDASMGTGSLLEQALDGLENVRIASHKPKTPTKQDLLEIIRELVEAGKPWGYTPERCGFCHNFSESGFCAKALGKGNVKHNGSPPDWCPRRKLAAATEKAEDEPVEV